MTAQSSKSKPKKTEQVGFKVEEGLFRALESAAWNEHRKRNELARLIFEWGFEKYHEAGSYDALIGRRHNSTEVPAPVDEKSYRKVLRKRVITDSQRVELAERARDQKRRPRTESANEQEKGTGQTDRD